MNSSSIGRPAGVWAWLVATALLACSSGCALLPSHRAAAADEAASAASAGSSASAPLRAVYRLDVQAPTADLRKLLANLDLARFQTAPATDSITRPELERLMKAAPTQVRGLVETAGYFNSVTTVTLEGDGAMAGGAPAALPVVVVHVEPGPRTLVGAVDLQFSGPVQGAAAAANLAAETLLRDLRRDWPLRPTQPFVQAAWTSAKSSTLARLRAQGYPAATWTRTAADVDAERNSVDLALQAASGPLYLLGDVRVDGLQRYTRDSVLKLATFAPGTPYKEQLLLDYQERLQKVGLFTSASVEIDPAPATAEAAPVTVHVKEQPLQQATIGLGFSANTGPRVSLEHTHRSVFGEPLVAKNKLVYGPDEKSWVGDLTSYPLDNLYRNAVSGTYQQLRSADEVRDAWSGRVGRAQETTRIDRTYYLEAAHARVETEGVVTNGNAVSANYNWVRRAIDNVLLPTDGTTWSLQGAFGYGRGDETYPDGTGGQATDHGGGLFVRAYSRNTWYTPLPSSFFATTRLEAGEVFARSSIGVPDTLLFRAGGDNSVRGYGYRTLGPTRHDVLASGRVLLTGSAEIAHPFVASLPAYLWALFVDAGNAADQWRDLHPAVGFGAGVRWRSPVGPLKLDVAYGERVHAFRLHLTVGVTF